MGCLRRCSLECCYASSPQAGLTYCMGQGVRKRVGCSFFKYFCAAISVSSLIVGASNFTLNVLDWISYIHIGLIVVLYERTFLLRLSSDFLFKSQSKLAALSLIWNKNEGNFLTLKLSSAPILLKGLVVSL